MDKNPQNLFYNANLCLFVTQINLKCSWVKICKDGVAPSFEKSIPHLDKICERTLAFSF